MKKLFRMRASFCAAWTLVVGLTSVVADPVLPYSLPIADKLTNEIAVLEAIPDRTAAQNQELNTDRTALNRYHRESASLRNDISILKGLDQLLGENDGFPFLIEQSAHDYLTDFELREAGLRRTVDMAPRSNIRSNAYKKLNAVSNALAKGEAASTTRALLNQLAIAASKLVPASNITSHAAAAKVKGSSAYAKIGKLVFNVPPGSSCACGANAFGTNQNGVFDFTAIDGGTVRRDITFHIEGVSSDTPATYELGVGANTAVYTITDPLRKSHGTNTVIQFYAIPGPETNRSVLIIDNIASNYMVGRFSFTGFTTNELTKVDTNQITTITNGEFQLTYTNTPPPPTL
jgi:hypothetical protein